MANTAAKQETVAPPLGELGEEYYCKRDDFMRYVEHIVNPERIRVGLPPLDTTTAGVCYRILNDFALQNKQRETLSSTHHAS